MVLRVESIGLVKTGVMDEKALDGLDVREHEIV